MNRIISGITFATLLTAAGCAPYQAATPATAAEQERTACAAVPDADRDQGPFANRALISRVEPVHQAASPKAQAPLAGVAVYVRATPGVTEQWLDRVIECHLAHRAIDTASPLAVADTRVAVSPTSDGFRVAITSENPGTAGELLARGEALVR